MIGPKVGCELSVRRGRRRLDGWISWDVVALSITGADQRLDFASRPAEWGNREFLTCLGCAVGGRLGLETAAPASPCRDNSEVQGCEGQGRGRGGAALGRWRGLPLGGFGGGGIEEWAGGCVVRMEDSTDEGDGMTMEG